MRRKHIGVLSFMISVIAIVNGCSKSYNPEPVPVVTTPPVNTTLPAPDLPAVPYNYSNTTGEIPPSIADLIKNSVSYLNSTDPIDNTPANNPITNEGATLGRVLFYDKNLSVNNKISCSSCHHPDKAFTDGTLTSEGFEGKKTRRNALSLVNLRYFRAKKMFWDFRAADLETQTLMPVRDMIEMGMPSLTALEQKIRSVSYYSSLFQKAFGSQDITANKIALALAQFIRSIISFNSKYDKGLSNNFADFTAHEMRGKDLVVTRTLCTECHSDLVNSLAKTNASFLIVDNTGMNIGAGSNNGLDDVFTDRGVGEITNNPADQGTFKIPTLRNVELTAPYMHDGRFATLEQVMDHYASGVKVNPNLGVQIPKNGFAFLTDQDKKDIIAFLKTLTDHSLAGNLKYANPFK